MKILFAANDGENSKITLSRFIQHLDKKHTLKIAAFKKSSPKGINIDWTLDCLMNIFRPDKIYMENDALGIYLEQIKFYSPDLIISDMEFFTSYVANILNIRLWQCSSYLMSFAAVNKQHVKLHNRYSHSVCGNFTLFSRKSNIIDNSERNLIYSHFGEIPNPPEIKNNFEWVRPYFLLGEESKICHHDIVYAGSSNKKILSLIKQYPDTVFFSENIGENYINIITKNFDPEEYICNVSNCRLFVSEGYSNFLSDAFYNKKFSVILANPHNIEDITNATYSDFLGTGTMIYGKEDLKMYFDKNIFINYDDKIKFLHEKIEEA